MIKNIISRHKIISILLKSPHMGEANFVFLIESIGYQYNYSNFVLIVQ